MATETVTHESPLEAIDRARASAEATDFELTMLRFIRSLASLKFTVALFAMAIFIVFAGTLAQHRKDIWEVVDQYFRVPPWPNFGFAWIEFQDLLVPAFFAPSKPPQVSGGFPFPGGWLIGGLMSINLLAAHGLRFKPQASGSRLWAGLGVIAAGMLATFFVIASGSNKSGVQESIWSDWSHLWILMQIGLGLAALASIAGFVWLLIRTESEWWLKLLAGHVPAILGGLFFFILISGGQAELDAASMRILWQLIKGAFAGLVLLGGCFMVFRKRAGVVLLHAGVGLMMLSEVLVGTSAIESQLWIREGEAVNFVRDVRKLELAFVDRTNPENVEAIVVPESVLLSGGEISHGELPVDVEVAQFLRNSEMRRLLPADERIATVGVGTELFAEPVRAGTGTDTGGEIDKSSAYVRLTSKDGNTDFGTYLVSTWFDTPQFVSLLRHGLRFRGELPQVVEVDGRTYEISLRFKRTYKPYTMKLDDVRKRDYVGTTTPRDYSSFVQLKDPSRHVDRDVRIWMNNPLRFGGETFYQSSFLTDPVTGREATVLQVVTNTGWMIPYVACMIVATGMLAHFLVVLVRFLNRRQKEQAAAPIIAADVPLHSTSPDSPQVKMARKVQQARKAKAAKQKSEPETLAEVPLQNGHLGLLDLLLPMAVVLLGAFWIASEARLPGPAPDKLNLYEFGKIPVVYQGRQKPIDTLARNALRVISGKQTFQGRMTKQELKQNWDEVIADVQERWNDLNAEELESVRYDVDGLIDLIARQTDDEPYQIETFVESRTSVRQPAVRWLLDVAARPEAAERHKVFRIENLEVLETLGLQRRRGYRYSLEEFRENVPELQKQVDLARELPAEELSIYQRKVLEVDKRVRIYTLLAESLRHPPLPPLPDERDVAADPERALAGLRAFQQLLFRARDRQEYLAKFTPPLVVPVQEDFRQDEEITAGWGAERQQWETYATAWMNDIVRTRIFHKDPNPSTLGLQSIFIAYSDGDAAAFNEHVQDYLESLHAAGPEELDIEKTGFETFFNHFAPFFHSIWLYLAAFAIAALAWLGWNRPLNNASSWLIVFTLLLHTFAIISRIYISGRPPVTNLYSSAVFIGWGCVILGLVVEAIYRIGIGNVISAVSGFATLWIAHLLAGDGDTFTVLQAVLDTQFWLATHVTCITLGYATTFVAGLLGLLYVLRGVLTPSLTPQIGRDLYRMTYGTLCFAIFFSFVGTVLGGLWADDSWGRFWGWDPKENGALIIVLWNALVLHARWDGMIKERGLAVLAIFGNVVTAWSWFGVNELGIGLHSYGFTDGVLQVLALFVLSQLAAIGVGCLPRQLWWSFRRRQSASGSADV